MPLASIGVDNYLVNVTSTSPDEQQQYVESLGDVLPYSFGIYSIAPSTGLVTVTSAPLAVASEVTESTTLIPGVYLYGLVHPVSYSYDPDGESGDGTGVDNGQVMGLWGVLWVSAS